MLSKTVFKWNVRFSFAMSNKCSKPDRKVIRIVFQSGVNFQPRLEYFNFQKKRLKLTKYLSFSHVYLKYL